MGAYTVRVENCPFNRVVASTSKEAARKEMERAMRDDFSAAYACGITLMEGYTELRSGSLWVIISQPYAEMRA